MATVPDPTPFAAKRRATSGCQTTASGSGACAAQVGSFGVMGSGFWHTQVDRVVILRYELSRQVGRHPRPRGASLPRRPTPVGTWVPSLVAHLPIPTKGGAKGGRYDRVRTCARPHPHCRASHVGQAARWRPQADVVVRGPDESRRRSGQPHSQTPTPPRASTRSRRSGSPHPRRPPSSTSARRSHSVDCLMPGGWSVPCLDGRRSTPCRSATGHPPSVASLR